MSTQTPDLKPGDYYVSVIDGQRTGLLLGPFLNDHAAAIAMVEAARTKACETDPRAHWYAFGTCRKDTPPATEPGNRPGVLNAALGYSATARHINLTAARAA